MNTAILDAIEDETELAEKEIKRQGE